MNTRFHSLRDERGLSLIEILVAVAILVVAATIALTIYDISRDSFKKGENLTEQQQAVRIAFDKMTADLRMTGFNYNPDGAGNRPDEQIEAAFDTAVVIRADFDAEDATLANTPESTMIGTEFLAVSTGNDEIVGYVLAKPDGSSSGILRFNADISNPRDGVTEVVSVPKVAMVHDDPPYTLYRLSFNNDASTWGSNAFITRTPLIENVYAMNFRYYDTVGTQQNATFDLSSVAEDIGGAETPVKLAERTSTRRIGVELVGLTREPDLGWEDVNDPYTATQEYRKFSLAGDVTPRNIGMVGIRDISSDVTPPSKPATPSLVPGHCGGLYISWTANPTDDQVAYYRVNVGTSSGTASAVRTSADTNYYIGDLADATTYYVWLSAVDTAGNISVDSTAASTTTSNGNTPQAPLNPVASTDIPGAVKFVWDPVVNNTAADPSGDPLAPKLRDLAGYRVYRSHQTEFNSAHTTVVADENAVHAANAPSYPDLDTVNCRSYNYWATAVDACGVESAASSMATGNSYSNVAPAQPQELQAFLAGADEVRLTWEPVEQDADGRRAHVDHYVVYRSDPVPEGTEISDPGYFQYIGDVTDGSLEFTDRMTMIDGYTYFYAVSARDDCYQESIRSDPAAPTCAFSGEVVFYQPGNNQPVSGVVPITVAVEGGTDTYTGVTLRFTHDKTGAATEFTIEQEGTSWYYEWLADPPGPYTITATVINDVECMKSATIGVSAGTSVGCCLSPPNPELRPIVLSCDGPHKAECTELSFEVINNNCLTAVAVESMRIDWVDKTGASPLLTGVQFDGSLIWNVVPPSASPAYTTFSTPKPAIGVNRNSLWPVLVTYLFDKPMTIGTSLPTYKRNTLTTSFDFRLLDAQGLETSITGTCGPSTGMFNDMISGTAK